MKMTVGRGACAGSVAPSQAASPKRIGENMISNLVFTGGFPFHTPLKVVSHIIGHGGYYHRLPISSTLKGWKAKEPGERARLFTANCCRSQPPALTGLGARYGRPERNHPQSKCLRVVSCTSSSGAMPDEPGYQHGETRVWRSSL
jgi:hypothetical protein